MSEQRRSPSGRTLNFQKVPQKLHTSAEGTVFGPLYSALAFAGKQEGSFGIFERCFVAFHIVNNAPVVRYCEGASHIVGCF